MQSSFSINEEEPTAKRRRKSGDAWQPAPPSRIAGSYQRTKAPSACLVCRTRKTKCDNVRPVCGFCQRTGGDCHYAESERSRCVRIKGETEAVNCILSWFKTQRLIDDLGLCLGTDLTRLAWPFCSSWTTSRTLSRDIRFSFSSNSNSNNSNNNNNNNNNNNRNNSYMTQTASIEAVPARPPPSRLWEQLLGDCPACFLQELGR